MYKIRILQFFVRNVQIQSITLYTGVVNPKATIGKPCNGQRNVDACAGERQKTKKISSRPYFQRAVAKRRK